MAKVPNFTTDLHIIAKLGINPGPDNGLEPDQLQEKFDEAAVKIQKFINEQIIPTLNSYVASSDGLLSIEGGTMTGGINMSGNNISSLGDPKNTGDAATKGYVDKSEAKALPKKGGTMEGTINMGDNKISGLPAPESIGDAATKGYTDDLVKTTVNGTWHEAKVTLKANGWASRNQRINIPGLKSNSIVFASPDANVSAENVRVYRESDVWAYKQEEGYLHFWHYDDKPETDLIVNVVYSTEA